MIKTLKLTLLIGLSLLLSSCIETQEIEKIGIINARGIDLVENNQLKTTLVVFQFSTQAKELTRIITGKGKTIDGAMEDAEHTSVYKLVPGKIKLSLFGREMAEKGILPLLDTQARDAKVPDLKYLAVSNTTAEEILSVDESDLPLDIGKFLHGVIENHTTDHNAPRITLQDFLRIYYDIGQDNILPLFEKQEKVPKQNGVALFQGEKMVGKLSNEEMLLINLVNRTIRKQVIEISLPAGPFKEFLDPHNESAGETTDFVFRIKKGQSKTKLVDENQLLFETNTKMKVGLIEQSAGILLKDSHVIELIEKELNKEFEKMLEKLLTKLKDYKSDPIGYGRYYTITSKGQNITRNEWREKFPTIQVKFNVDVEIIRHGVID